MDEQPSKLTRVESTELDKILGVPFRVLDDGFIRVVDYMGCDESIVQAARISYGQGTRKVHEDRGLIRFLMRHCHTTPFEMCEIKFHVRVPMDCWRQWIRHRTANVNEYSTRYSEAIDAAQRTTPSEWRLQSQGNRQGSSGVISEQDGRMLSEKEDELHELSRQVYQERLSVGVAREQARKDLPLSTYTEAYWKIDLHNLLHFLSLRMDTHAQKEIREYACIMGNEIVAKWCPLVWEAFVDYRLQAGVLSGIEWEVVRAIIAGDQVIAEELAKKAGILSYGESGIKKNREREELEAKLQRLGVTAPWQSDDSG